MRHANISCTLQAVGYHVPFTGPGIALRSAWCAHTLEVHPDCELCGTAAAPLGSPYPNGISVYSTESSFHALFAEG
jgi:hypothetical protein